MEELVAKFGNLCRSRRDDIEPVGNFASAFGEVISQFGIGERVDFGFRESITVFFCRIAVVECLAASI